MDLTTNIYLTPKGEDELKNRTSDLGTRKRQVLMTLLGTSRSLETLLQRTILSEDEFVAEMQSLHQQGFVTMAAPMVASATGAVTLDDGVIMSEAKFLLTDFLVDIFGTSSQALVESVRRNKSVTELQESLSNIHREVLAKCPERIELLLKTIQEINATA